MDVCATQGDAAIQQLDDLLECKRLKADVESNKEPQRPQKNRRPSQQPAEESEDPGDAKDSGPHLSKSLADGTYGEEHRRAGGSSPPGCCRGLLPACAPRQQDVAVVRLGSLGTASAVVEVVAQEAPVLEGDAQLGGPRDPGRTGAGRGLELLLLRLRTNCICEASSSCLPDRLSVLSLIVSSFWRSAPLTAKLSVR